MHLTVVILTLNEELHIARSIESVQSIADSIIVVDSGSTDQTISIAKKCGATVLFNKWINHSIQFNWALDHLPQESEWVLRLDADEIVTQNLANEIAEKLPRLGSDVEGIYIYRRMTFLGKLIRHGGVFPIRILRIFRYGKGRCENRWMDEHIVVKGEVHELTGEIIDDNLNSLTWWTEKHNSYASREVIDILNSKFGFMPSETTESLQTEHHVGVKRWIKENVYARLPRGVRAFSYFLYRQIIRLGFLDGKEGTAFHVLQGLWYRYLVDAKLLEVEMYMDSNNADVVTAIDEILNIKIKRAE